MSRQTRTLLIIGGLGLLGLIALGSIARRYGQLLESRGVSAAPTEASEVRREVGAFLEIRRALRTTFEVERSSGARPLREALRGTFERGLREGALSRAAFRRTEAFYRAWIVSGPVPEEYRRAFESGVDDPADFDLGPYDPSSF